MGERAVPAQAVLSNAPPRQKNTRGHGAPSRQTLEPDQHGASARPARGLGVLSPPRRVLSGF